MRSRGFTVIELLASTGIVLVLGTILAGAGWQAYKSSSLAVSANTVRQLAAGASAYLNDHNHTYWKYRDIVPGVGVRWWFGLETFSSMSAGEGKREFDPQAGPLGAYVPAALRPDPSFGFTGKAFKPKYKFGYLGVGYNVLLADANRTRAWNGTGSPLRFWSLEKPAETVVFATSGQVNTFQAPASPRNPMIEEFYGVDDREVTVHFRHHGMAMVGFANGNAGFLPMEPSTRDTRAPQADVGRFAPVGSSKCLR